MNELHIVVNNAAGPCHPLIFFILTLLSCHQLVELVSHNPYTNLYSARLAVMDTAKNLTVRRSASMGHPTKQQAVTVMDELLKFNERLFVEEGVIP